MKAIVSHQKDSQMMAITTNGFQPYPYGVREPDDAMSIDNGKVVKAPWSAVFKHARHRLRIAVIERDYDEQLALATKAAPPFKRVYMRGSEIVAEGRERPSTPWSYADKWEFFRECEENVKTMKEKPYVFSVTVLKFHALRENPTQELQKLVEDEWPLDIQRAVLAVKPDAND